MSFLVLTQTWVHNFITSPPAPVRVYVRVRMWWQGVCPHQLYLLSEIHFVLSNEYYPNNMIYEFSLPKSYFGVDFF